MARFCIGLFIIALVIFASLPSSHAVDFVRRNFTEFGISLEVPSDYHITYMGDRELYISENPLENGHWDEKSFIFGAVWIADKDEDCPLNKYLRGEGEMTDYMTPVLDDGSTPTIAPDHYLISEEDMPWKESESGGLYKDIEGTYTTTGHGSKHPDECIFHFFRYFSNYRFVEGPGIEPSRRIPPFPNQEIYFRIRDSAKDINVSRRETDVRIVTSLGILCPEVNGTCGINQSISRLADALYADGHKAQIIDLEADDGGWTADEALSNESSGMFHDKAASFSENSTILIVGSYAVVPPCVYEDFAETEKIPGFMDNVTPRVFLSDDCYGTEGDGPADAIVARVPTPSVDEAAAYLDAMAAYHLARSNGAIGLNAERLRGVYGKDCPSDEIGFDYLLYTRPYGGFFGAINDVKAVKAEEAPIENEFSRYPMQYFALHGGPSNDRWYSEGEALITSNDSQPYPFSAMSAACFGGYLSGDSIPEAWLLEGRPAAYAGSTDISYLSEIYDFPIGSDIIMDRYYDNLDKGMEAGAALRDAKRHAYDYAYEDRLIGGLIGWLKESFGFTATKKQNMKNAMTYQMLGDPFLSRDDMVRSNASGCGWHG